MIYALVAGLALTGLTLASPPARSTTDFRIDPVHSHAEFGVRILWLHTIRGQFEQIRGQVRRDAEGQAMVDAHIAIDSVNMSSQAMRRWVLAPEFFDAARFPEIHFVADPVPWERLTEGGDLPGTLSMRGVVLPIHFELQAMHCPAGSVRQCPIEVHGTVSRQALGMVSHHTTLSDTVQLTLTIILEPGPE